jgi:hypothetical protein
MTMACKEEGLSHQQQCYPGDVEYADASRLADGASAAPFVRCNDNGTAYEPFDPPDAGGASDASEAGANCDSNAGLLGFMCPGCTRDDECASGTCVPFTNKGPHCSHACKSSVDCPPPSGGCGNNGFCKPQ